MQNIINYYHSFNCNNFLDVATLLTIILFIVVIIYKVSQSLENFLLFIIALTFTTFWGGLLFCANKFEICTSSILIMVSVGYAIHKLGVEQLQRMKNL